MHARCYHDWLWLRQYASEVAEDGDAVMSFRGEASGASHTTHDSHRQRRNSRSMAEPDERKATTGRAVVLLSPARPARGEWPKSWLGRRGSARASYHCREQLLGHVLRAGSDVAVHIMGREASASVVSCVHSHGDAAISEVAVTGDVAFRIEAPVDELKPQGDVAAFSMPPGFVCGPPVGDSTPVGFGSSWKELVHLTECVSIGSHEKTAAGVTRLVDAVVPRGFVLCGPQGCGKSAMAAHLARTKPFVSNRPRNVWLSCVDVLTSVDLQRTGVARWLDTHLATAPGTAPLLVVVDDIDAVGRAPLSADDLVEEAAAARDTETVVATAAGVVQRLLGVCFAPRRFPVVVAATARSSRTVAPPFMAAGRLERCLQLAPLSEAQRAAIIGHRLRRMTATTAITCDGGAGTVALPPQPELGKLCAATAKSTPGYRPADLVRVCFQALYNVATDAGGRRTLTLRLSHTMQAVSLVQSGLHRAYAGVKLAGIAADDGASGATWPGVGGYSHLKHELTRLVTWPLERKEQLKRFGIAPSCGILLHGPSGCGKTLLASTVARACGLRMIEVKGPELMSKYLGDSEAAVRRVFAQARASAPCLLFVDELDAIAGKRDMASSTSAQDVYDRVLSTLLNELDGVEATSGVVFLAASSSPDSLDSALIRAGRIDAQLLVPLPSEADRLEVLRVHTARMPLSGVRLEDTASAAMTCAELAAVCREAAMLAIRRDRDVVTQADFAAAVANSGVGSSGGAGTGAGSGAGLGTGLEAITFSFT